MISHTEWRTIIFCPREKRGKFETKKTDELGDKQNTHTQQGKQHLSKILKVQKEKDSNQKK